MVIVGYVVVTVRLISGDFRLDYTMVTVCHMTVTVYYMLVNVAA